MLIRSPLLFVKAFVDELNNALEQHQPGTRLSKLQCLWAYGPLHRHQPPQRLYGQSAPAPASAEAQALEWAA